MLYFVMCLRLIDRDVMLRLILVHTDMPTRGELSRTQGQESLVALLGHVSGDTSLIPNTLNVGKSLESSDVDVEPHLAVVLALSCREAQILGGTRGVHIVTENRHVPPAQHNAVFPVIINPLTL